MTVDFLLGLSLITLGFFCVMLILLLWVYLTDGGVCEDSHDNTKT